MEPLLVVLVVGCALIAAVRVGKGFWARARSIERHHQALGTLGDITQGPDIVREPDDAPPGSRSAGADGPHQAHVRIIGAEGAVTGDQALPPPRTVFSSGMGRTSPFHRPSRNAPSAAAMDAIATTASVRPGTGTRSGRYRRGGPAVDLPHVPGPAGPPLRDEGDLDHTLPGVVPPAAPLPLDERSTRPVPVAKAQVFYFDDLGVKPVPPPPLEGMPALAALASTVARVKAEDAKNAGSAPGAGSPAADIVGPDGTVVPGAELSREHTTRPGPTGGGGANPGRRPLVAAVLAVAAVSVALVAIALSLGGGGTAKPGHQASPPVSSAHKGKAVQSSAPRSVTVPPTVTTTTRPPQVADLVSTSAGTATYHITSSTASIVVGAKGPCWIEVRADSPSGQIVYEGTLVAGQRSHVTGPAWIRLGDPPEVNVMVNGKHLGPPGAEVAAPLNLQFTLADDA